MLKQQWDLREAHEKSLNDMEELKRFQGSTFDTIAQQERVIWWVFTPSALRLAVELLHARPRLAEALKKIGTARGHLHSYFRSPSLV